MFKKFLDDVKKSVVKILRFFQKVVQGKWHFWIFPYFLVEIYLFCFDIIRDSCFSRDLRVFVGKNNQKCSYGPGKRKSKILCICPEPLFGKISIFLRLIFLHHPKFFWPWIISTNRRKKSFQRIRQSIFILFKFSEKKLPKNRTLGKSAEISASWMSKIFFCRLVGVRWYKFF